MTALAAPLGRLSVCPTPIGNLDDVTLRVLATLRDADVIACEDTRHTRRLLDRHGLDPRALTSFHEHNEAGRVSGLLARMRAGERVALVSDAGMPVVSDPGFALVTAAIAAGVPVEVLPGASAVPVALVASGLPAASWRFVGFLPRRERELRTLLAGNDDTLVAFESPKRLAATLAVLADLDPRRPVAVCRELTKLHEEVARGEAAELAARFAPGAVKGEVVLVCGAAPARAADLETALEEVRGLVAQGARPRAAAGAVARLSGLAANRLYRELTSRGQ